MAGRQPVDLVDSQLQPYQGTDTRPAPKRPTASSAARASTARGGGGNGGRRASRPPTARRPPAPSTPASSGPVLRGGPVDTIGGLVLAVLVWGWIGLPMLRGGPAEVKKTLRAKFLNQGPDGSWLP